MPVPQSVWTSGAWRARSNFSPPTIRAIAKIKPSATRTCGGIKSCSNEYLTKNATPRKAARPPAHAKNLAPMNCSQLIRAAIAGRFGGGGTELGGEARVNDGTGLSGETGRGGGEVG